MAWVAAGPVVLVTALIAFAYYLFSIVYRLLLHPLAKIPGPKLAAGTCLYQAYYDTLVGRDGGCYTTRIVEMHRQYGPVVRIGPNEVHVSDPDFVGIVYPDKSQATDRHVYSTNPFVEVTSQIRDTTVQYFSLSAVTEREALIHRYAQKLCDKLEANGPSNKPVDIVEAYTCLSVDLMSDYCLSKPFTTLDDGTPDDIAGLRSQCLSDVKAARNGNYLPFTRLLKAHPPLLSTLLQQTTTTELTTNRPSQSHSSLPHLSLIQTLIRSSLPTPSSPNSTSPPSHIALNIASLNTYAAHTHSLLLSFSLPVSHTLALATYHLLANSPFLTRLHAELAPYVLDPTNLPPASTLRRLPYLTAVIHESLRLSNGIATRVSRIATEPVAYVAKAVQGRAKREYVFPSGTRVSTSSVAVHGDASVFPDPGRFAPQRWLKNGERRTDLEKYLVPFGRGQGTYVATELAVNTLYICLATVVMRVSGRLQVYETSAADVRFGCEVFGSVVQGENGVRVLLR